MAATTKTPAKKTLYAALGVGGLALDKARELPERAKTLPQAFTSRVPTLNVATLRELPKTVQQVRTVVPQATSRLVGDYRKLTDTAASRATQVYKDLAKRGESVVLQVRGAAPTKEAKSQTKTAQKKVKSAATAVKKAAQADVDAVATAIDTATEQAG